MMADLTSLADAAWRLYPHTYAQHLSPLVGAPWLPAPHLVAISRELRRAVAEADETPILLIALPPRHGKTELATIWSAAWFLSTWPDKNVIVCSETDVNPQDWSRRVRDLGKQCPAAGIEIREDASEVVNWKTRQGGGMRAVGVGGSIIGRGGNYVVIDDPHKGWNEAQSPTLNLNVWQWFKATIWSRREPGALIVVVHQRWCSDDLQGRIMRELPGLYRAIRFPALAEINDPLGRAEGEPLWPARRPKRDLERTREIDRVVFDAMYQQRPHEADEGRTYSSYEPLPWPEGNLLPTMPDPPADEPLHLSFDFNVNPGTHLIVGWMDQRADRVYARKEFWSWRAKTPDVVRMFADWYRTLHNKPRHVCVFGDRSGRSETSSAAAITDYQTVAAALEELGVAITWGVPKANPPIKARVSTFNDALCDGAGIRHYFVHPDCPRLMRDLAKVKPDEDGNPDQTKQFSADGAPTDSLTHPSSAEGYRLYRIRPLLRAQTVEIQRAIY